ncbi:helix-turn-helix domain-containing protein [Pseudomonas juntendi]|uniref:helix-turn-helix domain-containing protein n=1 Tax=Pseudomonas juntendi TaxID=2666183 RepID=UPI001F2CA160|nr:helix-turn-helix domain-containing protein [Pseudomonas juntendi]MCO7055123.1 helix-turn-helix domain-containing protein [Pseudomonas juntendi]UJM10795.1 helix-turn-helix domain-containing protein [Pseudomonas juntendi]
MSMELMVKAMKTKVGNPLRKLVLIKLADNASDQGECWPSYQHIADQCEISKRSVMNHINTLCGAGLLRKEIRKGGPKGNSSNVYYLTLSGAADSLGVVQEIHQGSAAGSPPSAADSLGGSAGAAPRTSHSFESVKEPVTEPVATQAEAVVAEGIVVPFTAQQPRCEIPADMPGPKDQSCKTFKAWANYAMAYRKRYHAWPVWNAKAGGQVGQLISRLGIDVAHHVAAYFLTINDARLINGCHNLGDLLAKAEAYHTQWVTNRQMNATIARQQEQTQANINAAQEAAEAIRSGQRGKRNAFL